MNKVRVVVIMDEDSIKLGLLMTSLKMTLQLLLKLSTARPREDMVKPIRSRKLSGKFFPIRK